MSMEHKGYTGSVEYDPDDRVFHGRVSGITDVVSFEGETVDQLETSFRNAVDVYLDLCAERGIEPQRPYSGRFVLRLPQEVHRDASIAARRARSSMNSWIVGAIQMRLDAEKPTRQPDVEERLSDAAGG
jgi:predicted HicB family RNase H-like nuclease